MKLLTFALAVPGAEFLVLAHERTGQTVGTVVVGWTAYLQMDNKKSLFELLTSAAIGAWKCNIPPFSKIMTDRRTNQTNGPTSRRTLLTIIGKLHFQ